MEEKIMQSKQIYKLISSTTAFLITLLLLILIQNASFMDIIDNKFFVCAIFLIMTMLGVGIGSLFILLFDKKPKDNDFIGNKF